MANEDFEPSSFTEEDGIQCQFPLPVQVQLRQSRRRESLEELLQQLYNPCVPIGRRGSTLVDESGSTTDVSEFSFSLPPGTIQPGTRLTEQSLNEQKKSELIAITVQLKHEIHLASQSLIRALKRRNQQMSKLHSLCNLLSAVLQAYSSKRSEDTKLKFTVEPMKSECGFQQWLEAMRAVARLPGGIPHDFRRKMWLNLAENYLKTVGIDWNEVRLRTFSEKLNPDDSELNMQIVKDLHRTGWTGLNTDRERILLKRVLLAYARYNKTIGYCQGFNVIAALIMEVMENKEEHALKVMIMLIEHVFPNDYFDQTLRALSVDMIVLNDLLSVRLPKLYSHLESLQKHSDSEYEPPLINVFSMQWFLTIFATVFPKHLVFRIWDSLMLEGSEILLRVALATFAKISRQTLNVTSADAFYELMSRLSRKLQTMGKTQCENLIQLVYSMADFPFPGLHELRDRHLWNIQPFSSGFGIFRHQVISILKSENDPIGCSAAVEDDFASKRSLSLFAKKSVLDKQNLNALKKKYDQMKQRQKQAKLLLESGLLNSPVTSTKTVNPVQSAVFNHFIPTNSLSQSVSVAPCIVQPASQQLKRRSSSSLRRGSDLSTTFSHLGLGEGSRNSDDLATVCPTDHDWMLSISKGPAELFVFHTVRRFKRCHSFPGIYDQEQDSLSVVSKQGLVARSYSCCQLYRNNNDYSTDADLKYFIDDNSLLNKNSKRLETPSLERRCSSTTTEAVICNNKNITSDDYSDISDGNISIKSNNNPDLLNAGKIQSNHQQLCKCKTITYSNNGGFVSFQAKIENIIKRSSLWLIRIEFHFDRMTEVNDLLQYISNFCSILCTRTIFFSAEHGHADNQTAQIKRSPQLRGHLFHKRVANATDGLAVGVDSKRKYFIILVGHHCSPTINKSVETFCTISAKF
ncbi:TBC1 domain family member 30 [Trichinella pseudospiralis]|uniref:TBC1 domain family member 30 n=1 Tax=Trichinella pseudospiralis TaxID=6337 RepID=A0A0V1K427_TRIPS|nr:TBC1 domain family member 30 [Trichinella pseudospiralis]